METALNKEGSTVGFWFCHGKKECTLTLSIRSQKQPEEGWGLTGSGHGRSHTDRSLSCYGCQPCLCSLNPCGLLCTPVFKMTPPLPKFALSISPCSQQRTWLSLVHQAAKGPRDSMFFMSLPPCSSRCQFFWCFVDEKNQGGQGRWLPVTWGRQSVPRMGLSMSQDKLAFGVLLLTVEMKNRVPKIGF